MAADVTVLMYHAIGDDRGDTPGADPRYAVSAPRFAGHLRHIKDAGLSVSSVLGLLNQPQTRASVAFTFDDGHASNARAATAIAAQGGSADFFVNPSTVGTTNYLGWSDLRAMAEAGMSIQSHGFHHRYLDDLSAGEVEAELVDSKREIEDRLGKPVEVFAPPGGRVAPGLEDVAARAGYRAICSSRVGLWRLGDSARSHRAWDVPRFAVLSGTSDEQLDRWIQQRRLEMIAQLARYSVLKSAKSLLGNQGYERLRKRLLRTGS